MRSGESNAGVHTTLHFILITSIAVRYKELIMFQHTEATINAPQNKGNFNVNKYFS